MINHATNSIEIYKSKEGKSEISVSFDNDTAWLSLKQISELFDRDKSVISRHLKNLFETKELKRSQVVAFFATTASDGREYKVEYFNLDAIISIGYRVNSKQGTQFRIWATQKLKEYLVQGYAINQDRLKELHKIVEIIEKSGDKKNLKIDETKGLIKIISTYARSFDLLNKFDSNNLENKNLSKKIIYKIGYEEAKEAIFELKKQLVLKKEAANLFGNEKDKAFDGTLQAISQTFGGKLLYPTIEEQAAHLLYFIIKNHHFSDGNKRIGAFLFMWFLQKNKHHFKKNGEEKINDNGLVALALLVASSNPKEKNLIVQLIVNLINNN